jgi:hypothetical protein
MHFAKWTRGSERGLGKYWGERTLPELPMNFCCCQGGWGFSEGSHPVPLYQDHASMAHHALEPGTGKDSNCL